MSRDERDRRDRRTLALVVVGAIGIGSLSSLGLVWCAASHAAKSDAAARQQQPPNAPTTDEDTGGRDDDDEPIADLPPWMAPFPDPMCPSRPGRPSYDYETEDGELSVICLPMPLDKTLSEEELEACSQRIAANHAGRRQTGGTFKWTLERSTPLLPGLRIYRGSDRYPHTLWIDLVDGTAVEEFDMILFNHRLRQRGIVVDDPEVAKELGIFIAAALQEPYGMDLKSAKVETTGSGIDVYVLFEKTIPWSEGNDILAMMHAGAKRSGYGTKIRFRPDGCANDLGTTELVVLDVY